MLTGFVGLNGHGHSLNGNARPIDGNRMLAEGRLLDGLGHWVDRLFDGSLTKCKVDHWPTFPIDEPQPELTKEDKKDQ